MFCSLGSQKQEFHYVTFCYTWYYKCKIYRWLSHVSPNSNEKAFLGVGERKVHLQLHSINSCFLLTSDCTTVLSLCIFSLNEKLADQFPVIRDLLKNPLHTDKKTDRISVNFSESSLVKNVHLFKRYE